MLQQQQTSARSQYQYLPSGPNSIPPSRDPKQQQSTGVAPPGPPSQVGTPTMAIQPHLTSVPAAGATAAAAIQAAQPLPATTSVPQPSVGGSGVTAVSSAGVPAAQAGGQGVSGQQQQTQGGSVAQVQVQQVTASAQPVPAQPQTYLESVNRDSHPIPSDELVERLEDISKQQGSPDAAEDSER